MKAAKLFERWCEAVSRGMEELGKTIHDHNKESLENGIISDADFDPFEKSLYTQYIGPDLSRGIDTVKGVDAEIKTAALCKYLICPVRLQCAKSWIFTVGFTSDAAQFIQSPPDPLFICVTQKEETQNSRKHQNCSQSSNNFTFHK